MYLPAILVSVSLFLVTSATPLAITSPDNASTGISTTKPDCLNDPNDPGHPKADVRAVRACADYLRKLGKQDCVVDGIGATGFCKSPATGPAAVRVFGMSNTGYRESSWCEDVASAVDWVVANCQSGGFAGGKYTEVFISK